MDGALGPSRLHFRGRLHVVDAILAVMPNLVFKQLWFDMDRGANPRRLEYILQLAEAAGRVTHHEIEPVHRLYTDRQLPRG